MNTTYQEMVSLLNEEARLLDEYLTITRLLPECFENEDIDAIESHIRSRQDIIAAADKLHQDIQLLMQSYTLSEGTEKESVSRIEEDIQKKLSVILDLDDIARKAGEARMSEIGGEAKQSATNRKSLGAYNQKSMLGHVPGYIDKKQ